MGCLDHWCFYLNSNNGYFGICTTWWNNNKGLKVNSHTKLATIGPKVSSPRITGQMLGEVFNDFISPTNHESFNVFTWFNEHVHDDVKVIIYYMSHTIVLDFFH